MSTWPYLCRFHAPTSAFGNLWHRFEATATTPGTPRLIMPGVSTNAPPLPMKPLTSPPMKPTMSRKATPAGSRVMNCSGLIPGPLPSPAVAR